MSLVAIRLADDIIIGGLIHVSDLHEKTIEFDTLIATHLRRWYLHYTRIQ